jgi:hypothetical protein
MSETYAGVNSYAVEITIPDDGDDKAVVSVDVSIEGLADRTAYLKARLDGTSPGAHLDTPTIDDPTLTGTVAVGTATFSGTVTGDGGASFPGVVSVGALAESEALVPDSDATAAVPAKATYLAIILTGDRIFQMDLGLPGQRVRFVSFEAAHTLTIKNQAGVVMTDPSGNSLILKAAAAGFFNSLEIMFSHVAGDKWIYIGGVPN